MIIFDKDTNTETNRAYADLRKRQVEYETPDLENRKIIAVYAYKKVAIS